MITSRRQFLRSVLAVPAAVPALRDDSVERVWRAGEFVRDRTPEDVAADEDYWHEIQLAFDTDRTLINLNNGGVCPSPRVVQDALRRHLEYSNQVPVYHMWRHLEPQIESVRRGLARAFGCDPEEMAITRNASEALEICQFGLNLKPGDEVLTTDQDYGRMLTTWQQRVRRDGIVLKQVSHPVPAPSMEYLVDMFRKGITPKTRVIHFVHINNLNGQIFPVKEICQLARSRGIEAIVDGAHAFAHFPFTRDEIDVDYYGTSLHKWLLAPIGTGFLYVRRSKIRGLWPLMAAPDTMDDNIRKFEEIGTHPAANHNAIAEALTFHEGIGIERKAARLRYLRDRWMKRLDGQPRVKLYTSYDPAMSCGLANVGIEGIESGKLADYLFEKHRIIVTGIGHPACPGIRVTPNVYTTLQEVDTFAAAVEGVIRRGMV
ncbi:MAG TPA: aminotransferase class V-fold PLP-dependent enzyme [Gemmatimonadales bacterium]|nr:aminotransferase class V-fold PLP-dependent enzyme [Gemmatimonadales bacterium]